MNDDDKFKDYCLATAQFFVQLYRSNTNEDLLQRFISSSDPVISALRLPKDP